jgi:hypothetical protein
MRKLLDHFTGVGLVIFSLMVGGFALYSYQAATDYEEALRRQETEEIAVWNNASEEERKQIIASYQTKE